MEGWHVSEDGDSKRATLLEVDRTTPPTDSESVVAILSSCLRGLGGPKWLVEQPYEPNDRHYQQRENNKMWRMMRNAHGE